MGSLVLAYAVVAAAGSPTLEGILLNLGLPGVVILALGLYARGTIKASDERTRRYEDDNRRLNQIMADQMIPALTRANENMVEVTRVLSEMRARDERQQAIEEARRALEARHDT